MPILGIFVWVTLLHKNVDDVIEPFRPFIDSIVYDLFVATEDFNDFLQKEHKVALLGILNQKCLFENQNKNISIAIDSVCESLKKTIIYNKNEIPLPKI